MIFNQREPRALKYLIRTFTAILLCCLLVACGGGGGTSISRPPVPSTKYSGSTTEATLGKRNAVGFGSSVVRGIQLVMASAISIYVPTNDRLPIARHFNGPVLGSADFTGQFNKDGTGWGIETFKNYQYYNIDVPSNLPGLTRLLSDPYESQLFTENGTVDIYLNQGLQNTAEVTLGFSGLEIANKGEDYILNGSITEHIPTYPGCQRYTGSLSIKAKNTSKIAYLKGITIAFCNSTKQYSPGVTVSGTVYNSGSGYAAFSSETPVYYGFSQGDISPSLGGPIKLTGATAATSYVSILNSFAASIGMDNNGDGLINDAVRYSWVTDSVDKTPGIGNAPLATVTRETDAYVGSTVTLDGRGSHSPSGSYLTFSWTLIMAPAGSMKSTVDIGHADTPTPDFTPDKAGDYLFELQVSDGTNVGKQYYVLPVNSAASLTSASPAVWNNPAAFGPTSASVGQTIEVDGSASGPNVSDPNNAVTWCLVTPPGSKATLSTTMVTRDGPLPESGLGLYAKFVPDVPGYYVAVFGGGGPGGCSAAGFPLDQLVVINVGEKRSFAPPVMIGSSTTTPVSLVISDLDGDGNADISANGNVFYSNGHGGFDAPVQAFGKNLQYPYFSGNFDGSGPNQILTQGVGALQVNKYQSGSLGVASTDTYDTSGCAAGSGTLNAAAVPDTGTTAQILATASLCKFVTFEPDGSGGYGPALYSGYSLPTGVTIDQLAIDDVTGDTFPDMLGLEENDNYDSGGVPVLQLAVFDGSAAGTYSSSASSITLPLGGAGFGDVTAMVLGRLSSDGLNDVVVSDTDGSDGTQGLTNKLDVFYRDQSRSLSTTPTALNTAASVEAPLISDLDGDGRNDLIVLHHADFGFYLQQQDGSLGPELLYPTNKAQQLGPVVYGLGGSARDAIADINGDGLPDLIIYTVSGDVYVMLGIKPTP